MTTTRGCFEPQLAEQSNLDYHTKQPAIGLDEPQQLRPNETEKEKKPHSVVNGHYVLMQFKHTFRTMPSRISLKKHHSLCVYVFRFTNAGGLDMPVFGNR